MLGRSAASKILCVRPVGSPENTSNIEDNLGGFKKALLQNPREMIRDEFSAKWFGFRVTGRKSELQTKSPSCSRADPQNPNRIAQKKDPNGV